MLFRHWPGVTEITSNNLGRYNRWPGQDCNRLLLDTNLQRFTFTNRLYALSSRNRETYIIPLRLSFVIRYNTAKMDLITSMYLGILEIKLT